VILREGLNVRGMNTAATIWCTGAVGTLAGAGFRAEAATGATAILVVHLCLRPVVRWMDSQTKTAVDVETYYRLRVVCMDGEIGNIRAILLRHIGGQARMSVQGIARMKARTNGKSTWSLYIPWKETIGRLKRSSPG
jgi:putative Mg2+ transporter-C (MgtC) family protein